MHSTNYDDDYNPSQNQIQIGNDFSHLFACGKNENYELTFRGYKVIDTPSGISLPKNKTIKYVSSGASHSALVTSEGQGYMLGSTLHGKLGLPTAHAMNIASPRLITIGNNGLLSQIVCGDYHTLALTFEGEVFGWGGNLHKKLAGNSVEPTKIEHLGKQKIVKIACGDFHSVALSGYLISSRDFIFLGWRRSPFQ